MKLEPKKVRQQHEEHHQELLEQQKTFTGQQEALTWFVETKIEKIKDAL